MSTAPEGILKRLELAKSVAVEAGQHTLQYFQQANLEVERKSDQSPVTVADRQAEQIIRDKIAAAFPADGILGEEFGETVGTSEYRWILDPIDGTKSFISGVPLYGTMIGVERDQRCDIGVVYVAGLDEGIHAAKGQGAWHFRGNSPPTAARVSTKKALADGVFVTSQIDSFEERGAAPVFEQLQRTAYVTRTWGDCYGYLLVATGRVELMVDPIMNVWDAAPLRIIMEEAGGTFTDWQGNATIHAGEGIATNGLILEEVLKITRPYPNSP